MDHTVEVREIQRFIKTKHVEPVAGIASRKVSKKADKSKEHFPLGVMAGDAEPEGKKPSAEQSRTVLWTKYTGKEKELTVRIRQVSPKPKGDGLLPDRTAPVKGKFVHYDAKDLNPGTKYEYRFLEKAGGAEAHSPVGHFWTPIERDAYDEVEFGGTSCTFQYEDKGRKELTNRNLTHAVHEHKSDLRFFVHLGDHLYCDALKSNPAATLGEFRTKYKVAYTRAGLKALHKAFGMYNTWDDHEVFNNWIGKGTRAHILPAKLEDKVKDSRKLTVKSVIKTGVRSFYDHHPIRKTNRTKKKLWRSFRWGKTLELFILDCRSERALQGGLYISKAQEKWLVDGINKSEAVFKFVLSSRPIGYLPHKPKDTGKPPEDDYRWADPCVRKQRDRILKKTRNTKGVWWLSGDVHFGTTGFVDPPKKGKMKVGEVLMGPGGQWVGKPGSEKWNKKIKKGGFIDKLDKMPDRFRFATLHSNYVVIRAVAKKDDVEKSTLKISYFGGNKRPAKLLHWETRSYDGEVINWYTRKLPGQTSPSKGGQQP